MKPIGRQSDDEPPRESFLAVYVDRIATPDVVRAAVARAPLPAGIECATVDDTLFTETFDCRVVVYLTGDFDAADGPSMARGLRDRIVEPPRLPGIFVERPPPDRPRDGLGQAHARRDRAVQ